MKRTLTTLETNMEKQLSEIKSDIKEGFNRIEDKFDKLPNSFATKEEQRQDYRDLYNQSGNNDFYRDYSKTNPDEDFADNFALYYLNKNSNYSGIHQFKINYIGYVIKKGNK